MFQHTVFDAQTWQGKPKTATTSVLAPASKHETNQYTPHKIFTWNLKNGSLEKGGFLLETHHFLIFSFQPLVFRGNRLTPNNSNQSTTMMTRITASGLMMAWLMSRLHCPRPWMSQIPMLMSSGLKKRSKHHVTPASRI